MIAKARVDDASRFGVVILEAHGSIEDDLDLVLVARVADAIEGRLSPKLHLGREVLLTRIAPLWFELERAAHVDAPLQNACIIEDEDELVR